MRIVIADDEAITRRLLRALLAASGHEVLEAVDGEAAWDLLQSSGAAMLITDWLMPRLDGRSLIQRIRSSDQPGYVYAILLTSRDSKPDMIAGLDGGADDYLTKPFHPEELRARVSIGARILALETSLREARDGFAYQASHDPLTGLLNRMAIMGHVRAELARADRASYSLSLALLDLDHFKQVNDAHGHLVGDQALCHIAQRILAVVRPYDWVGRWGGEEFLVVLANSQREEAAAVAERIRVAVMSAPLMLPADVVLPLTVSIGVACNGPAAGLDTDAVRLFQQADAALYAAKRAGRNRLVCADILARPG
jgi:two-component system chemotaxis response regulator CheY